MHRHTVHGHGTRDVNHLNHMYLLTGMDYVGDPQPDEYWYFSREHVSGAPHSGTSEPE